MSWQAAVEPVCEGAPSCDPVDTVIVPRARDIGDFEVRRALPASERQMIGPFIFFDQMGPTVLGEGRAMDVRPHPHIGLATITWLVEGEIRHQDSLGYDQPIRPGEVNWMTAGRGIVHSERTPDALRGTTLPLLGIQTWVALPHRHEETAPAFEHYAADAIPAIAGEGLALRLIAGSAWGASSPVSVLHETLYAEARMEPGARLPLDPGDAEERGIYVIAGDIAVAGADFGTGQLLVLKPGHPVTVEARSPAHLMVLGGASMDGPRHIWWNFVSSSAERLEAAKADWREQRFPEVPGDPERIPLPDG